MGNKSHFFRQSSGGGIGSPFLNFRFEESITDDNTVIDNIGGLNATLIGNKTVRENTGVIERGYKFDGSTAVELQQMTLQYPFCVKMWVNNTDASVTSIFSGFDNIYKGFDFTFTGNVVYIQFGNGGTPNRNNRKSYQTLNFTNDYEVRQFVVVFKNDFDFDLYIDGLKYTNSYAISGNATTVDLDNIIFNIGYAGGQYNNGNTMDEITMFDQELTPEEIAEIYNKESNGIRVF